jgi:hypothetical protein
MVAADATRRNSLSKSMNNSELNSNGLNNSNNNNTNDNRVLKRGSDVLLPLIEG